ncbi:MAG: helix-turn-helix domain-containing protein [Chloroflexota bacterium]|nr:helix-turn-helix domain-containing protein [Chloroflexota bacterium]
MAAEPKAERKLLLTVREVADLLGFHEQTIYRMMRRGTIPPDAIRRFGEKGNHIRISRAWLEKWAGGGVE